MSKKTMNKKEEKKDNTIVRRLQKQLEEIFDAIQEVIYVANPETNEILFCNKFFRNLLGENPQGKICYEVFQGFSDTCDFCTNDRILQKPGVPYQWEYYNPSLDMYFNIVDMIIEWYDCKNARFELAIDITAKKLLERELNVRNLAIDSSLNGFVIADLEGVITYANKAYCTLIGIDKEEIEGKHNLQLGTTPDESKKIFQLLLKEGKWMGELSSKKQDGTNIDLLISTNIIYDDNNNPKIIAASMIDVSKQKRIERDLKLMNHAVNTSMTPIGRANLDGEIEYVNDAYLKLWGYETLDQVVGKTIDSQIIDRNALKEVFDELKNNSKYEGQLTGKRFDGTIFPFYIVMNVIYENQVPVGYIASFMDVAEKMRIQQEIQEKEARYRQLIGNMSSGVAVYEIKNNGKDILIKDFNKTAEVMEGVQKEDVIGKKIDEVFPGVKDFGLYDVILEVWKTGDAKHHPISFYKDNRISGWRENYVYKLPSEEIVAIYTDITKQKQAEEIMKKSSISRTLVGKMFHDLKETGNLKSGDIFNAGWKFGKEMTGNSLNEMLNNFEDLGFGRIMLHKEDKSENFWVFLGEDLLERKEKESTDEPTGSYALGFLCGIVSQITDSDNVVGVEIECQSMGDEFCKFIIRSR